MKKQAALIVISTLLTLALGCPIMASPKAVNTTIGLRLGDNMIESYADFITPIYERNNAVAFINPRVSLHDQGENEFNIGLGYRHFLPEKNIILGTNVFFDTRRTKNNKRYNQVGLGFEALSEKVDFRANYYKPENNRNLITESNGLEDSINTEILDSTTTATTAYGDPYASVNSLFQDREIATTVNNSVLTTTTTTHRFYEKFESAFEGYDAEIGFKLPLSLHLPETKLFAGYYDYKDNYGNRANGTKARLEMRSGDYLTFDAEVFGDDELNDTDYFVGVRLSIPFDLADIADIAAGRNPFRGLKKKLFNRNNNRTLKDRLATEMVRRDVRIQTHESDFIERADKATVVGVQESTAITSEITSINDTLEVATNITFVDGDNSSGEDGTAENPYNTLTEGIANAGGNNTIYLHEVSAGAGTYDEKVTLQANQTLTSSIDVQGGKSFNTINKPKIQPTTAGVAVITFPS